MTADEKPAVRTSGAEGSAPSQTELKRLGKYAIEKKIGAGGMGAVYLARDEELKRTVALKVLPRDKAANPILVRRFRAEAQAAAQLRHPNIVAVFDSGEADGYLYIAMEYVDGRDLFEMVSLRGVVPIRRSIEIIRQVAEALQHAYEQNIVHRDIKPSNLLIRRDGVVKLTDLGLARSIDDTLETNITRAGTTVGTVDYMAPEQARNSKLADIRSDLYSLGCTWFQMLTGAPPYPEGSVTNKLQAHAIKPIPDPREKNPNIPEGLTAVIRRMMAKKPEDRYQTPAELLDELAHAKLTQASISREIFADLSDYDQDAIGAAVGSDSEEFSDGYLDLDNDRQCQVTPEQVSRPSSVRKTRNRAPEPEPPEPTVPVHRKSPPRTSRSDSPDRNVSDESESVTRRSRPRPVKTDAHDEPDESHVTRRPSRNGESEADQGDDVDQFARKPRPRSTRSEVTESGGMTKPAETRTSAKAKIPGQKVMPPKREPIKEEGDAGNSGLPEFVKYVGAVVGLILVITGIGWLISGWGNPLTVDKGPIIPAESTVENPPPVVPVVIGTTKAENPASADPTAVVAIPNNPSNVRHEAFDVEKVPAWATKDPGVAGLQSFTVGPGAKTATSFPTVEEALKAAPPGGAVIKLQGAGPFPLPLVELHQCKRIVMTSANPQDRPVILLKPADGASTAGIQLKDGVLELRGLHFTIDRQVVTGPVQAVEVIDGQLMVQQCSFTASGASTQPVCAMSVSSPEDSNLVPRIEPNLLIDRVMVRGDGLVGLRIRRANVDAMIRDSLFVSGSAPALELSGHITGNVAEVALGRPRRVLRLQRCTLLSQTRIFDLSVDEGGKPPPTAIALKESLCAAQGLVSNSAIAYAGHWPQVRTTSESWLTKMTWLSSNTLYFGFEQLIDLGASFKVTDAATWQRVWNERADARQFQKITFPETLLDDLAVVLPQEFDSSSLSYREITSSAGSLPGCPVDKLSVPEASSQQRATLLSSRPPLPQFVAKPSEPVQVRKVDLKKEDLGLALNRDDWPSGTLFEASGGGICQMTPARIDGKSVRIVFYQSEGASLRVQPVQPKGADVNGGADALITVTRGTLELSHAVLEGYPNSKGYTPEWLIQATNSNVLLDGCRLLGPEVDGPRHAGLIRWTTGTSEPPNPNAPSLVVRDSFLAGPGTGVRAESGEGGLFFRNSVVAIRGDALDLRPIRSGTSLLSSLDAENTTLSATAAAIRFQAAPGPDGVTAPFRMFIERTVFGPPLVFKAGEAAKSTLLQCDGPAIEQHQIQYSGAANGVARQVVYLVRRDGDTGAPADDQTGLTAWRKLWDKGGSVRLLTGDKGVYLAGELPVRWKELKPSSFDLHKKSQASTWGDAGRPIGANARGVEDSSIARKPGDPSRVNVTPLPNSTKKNVGF
ncbi:MAG: serine/threonine protein kinase [Planctomycetes bacterium]|nr:serine/threonine protein kinase [Planctomycetota bacterium]